MNPELIVFDCDGVLVDSEVIVIEVEADLLAAGGFPITADEIAERYVGLSYPDMMRGLELQFGRPVPDALGQEVQDRAVRAFEGRLQPVPGIPERLDRHQGLRCVAIVLSGHRGQSQRCDGGACRRNGGCRVRRRGSRSPVAGSATR